MTSPIHVAVAVIRNASGQLCITRRPERVHQGGKLEFPGGKVEPGENVQQALQRELHEELGIRISSATPLIKLHHDYGDQQVCLDVWEVTGYTGDAHGKEGQSLYWLNADSLQAGDFPAANVPIITALKLPRQLMITPDRQGSTAVLVEEIDRRIQQHQPERIILRLPRLSLAQYREVAAQLLQLQPTRHWHISGDIALAQQLRCSLHLPARCLHQHSAVELAELGKLASVSASIHNPAELRQAEQLGVSFALLGSVQATASHPDADSLGWAGFAALVNTAQIPIYALGGLSQADLPQAIALGAQGIAGIRLFA